MALRTPLSVTPHLYMGDSTGRPLDMGTVYFGEQDKDPEFYPIELFSDDALTLPLMQPVHTKGGYLYDKGDMVEPHAKELIYSVKVLDSYGRKVFYKGAMMRNSWNDDVIQQINAAIVASTDIARQIATDITNDAINNTAIEGGVLADTFVTVTANGAGSVARTQRDKNADVVSVKDFGAKGDGVTDDTAAIHAAMTYLMDRFTNGSIYPGGPGHYSDFSSKDRRTGSIFFPAGTYRVSPEVFNSLTHPRSGFVGFEFIGEHRLSSVLLLTTGGEESWFYGGGESPSRYQRILFKSLGFRSDNYLYGNGFKIWSNGGPKQFRFEHCDFENLQKFLYTEGTGNADLTKVTNCTGMFFGDILTLNNNQSVQHDFIGSDLGTYGNYVRVMNIGGGNVNIINGSIDFVWHEDFSPPTGNHMFSMDSDANIGAGNMTFTYRDLRVEVEAYKRTAGAPPFGLVYTAPQTNPSYPKVLFDNVCFVNGQTYTLPSDWSGSPVSAEYRRITAVVLNAPKMVTFRDCVLLKNFFYHVNGTYNANAIPRGGQLVFDNCFDGTATQLPAVDSALDPLHSRVTYTGTAGRVITRGMTDSATGVINRHRLLDADPNWRYSMEREQSSVKHVRSLKHPSTGWMLPDTGANEISIFIPPRLMALRVYIDKPEVGGSTDEYQLHFGSDDKSVIIASSTLAQMKDRHTIDISHVDLSAYTKLRIWATGTGTAFYSGGIAYIEYV